MGKYGKVKAGSHFVRVLKRKAGNYKNEREKEGKVYGLPGWTRK